MDLIAQFAPLIPLGFLWLGLPAAAFVYLMLLVGRKVGRRLGMRVAAAGTLALFAAPFIFATGNALMRFFQGQPPFIDAGLIIAGGSLIMTISCLGAIMLGWAGQINQAMDASEP